jgi:hypothetical protein
MTTLNQIYHVTEGDDFLPTHYPEVEKELTAIMQDTRQIHSVVKGEMIVSYFKDHCLKTEWTKDYPELTARITSRHFKTTHLQSLFDSCRDNKTFLAAFESHIRNVPFRNSTTIASESPKLNQ